MSAPAAGERSALDVVSHEIRRSLRHFVEVATRINTGIPEHPIPHERRMMLARVHANAVEAYRQRGDYIARECSVGGGDPCQPGVKIRRAQVWFLSDRQQNINWASGIGHPPRRRLPARVHLLVMMLGFPLLVFVPTHALLRTLF